jgi:hypothetical protein
VVRVKCALTRILVCGSRNFTNSEAIMAALLPYREAATVIHGGAPGADTLADVVARALGMDVLAYKADWKRHGKAAGPIRNQQMLDEGKPDLVIAFPLPGSIGTLDMITRARRAGIAVDVKR